MRLIPVFLACAGVLPGRDAPASDEPLNGEGYAYFGGICAQGGGCDSMLKAPRFGFTATWEFAALPSGIAPWKTASAAIPAPPSLSA